MVDPVSDPGASSAAPQPASAPPSVVLTHEAFKALLASRVAAEPFRTTVDEIEAANALMLARLKKIIADAEGAAGHVHGAAKALQADVKANWPMLLIGTISVVSLAMHFIKLFGFGG